MGTVAPLTRTRMRAAVLVDVGRFELRDVPSPEPGPRDVRIRVQAVGICGTDLHIASGEANYNTDERGRPVPLSVAPQILGHEIAGEIVETGSAVVDLRVGHRVVVDQGRSCVSEARPLCEYCATGDSHQCAEYREHGITGLPGGFAEYLTIPAVNAVAVESGLASDEAVLAEPLGCVIHASDVLLRTPARYRVARGGADAARAVVIYGAGPAGLLFVQYLRRVVGYEGTLIVSEPAAGRRVLAERFGATTVDPAAAPLVETVRQLTGGRGAELVIDASGSGAVFQSIPGILRKQGTLLLYGHGHGGTDLSVLNAVQFREPTILSPVGASGGHEADGRPTTYVRALRHIEAGTIDAGSLVTHRYPSLEGIPAAFSGEHRLPEYVKGVVTL